MSRTFSFHTAALIAIPFLLVPAAFWLDGPLARDGEGVDFPPKINYDNATYRRGTPRLTRPLRRDLRPSKTAPPVLPLGISGSLPPRTVRGLATTAAGATAPASEKQGTGAPPRPPPLPRLPGLRAPRRQARAGPHRRNALLGQGRKLHDCGVSSYVFWPPDYFERVMPMTALDAIGSEVVAIDGENCLQIVTLRHGNE